MFVFLILDLNVVKDEIQFLISLGSLHHRYGPKYLTECLPYLNLARAKSEAPINKFVI